MHPRATPGIVDSHNEVSLAVVFLVGPGEEASMQQADARSAQYAAIRTHPQIHSLVDYDRNKNMHFGTYLLPTPMSRAWKSVLV
jgi:hypothetical protein